MKAALTALTLGLTGLTAQAEELKLWHAYRGAEEAALLQAAEAFEEQTGIEVVPVGLAFGAFDSKLETAVPRGNGPDLFIAGHAAMGKWRDLGLMQALPALSHDWRGASEGALDDEDGTWGYPLALKTLVLLYDPSVVTEPPATTDELIAQARAFTEGDRYGLVYETTAAYYFAPWMHAFGAEAGADVRLDSTAHVDALAFARQLGRDESIVPLSPTSELMSQLYEEGHAAFVISGPWFVGDIARPIAATTLPVVSATGEPARPYLTVEGVFVADQAAHPEEAQRFAAFLAGPDGARIRQSRGAQAVAYEGLPPSEDVVVAAVQAQAEQAVLMPTDAEAPNTWEALERGLRQLMRGAATPEQAAASAQLYKSTLTREAPEAADPAPYLVLFGGLLLALLGYAFAPLTKAEFRARVAAHRADYMWVGPAGLAMLALVALPFVTGAGVAFFSHQGGEWTFVGLRHFADILLSKDWAITSPMSFWYTLVVTVLWTVLNVALHVGLGIALALILREPWIRLRGMWRALLIIPWAIPNYITALIWKTMFHVQFGAINGVLTALTPGDAPVQVDWFSSFATSFSANLITNTWLGFPFMMVVTLGALQAIPRDLEEAATVDGAGAVFRFRHVVWPLLKPALMPAIILGSVWTFNMFNVIYLVSAGEPDGGTEILISEAYRWAFSRDNRYGYAAAYAVLIFGVLWLYSRFANRMAGRKVL